MRYHTPKPEIKTREAKPGVKKTPKGVEVLCPFCTPPHPILPGVESPCGTTLKVTAVQFYLPSHTTRRNNLHCLKCGEVGGEMIRYRGGYIHMTDCKPEVKLLTENPPLSSMAKVIYNLPKPAQKIIEKFSGKAQQLQEIDVEGKPTGKILGYFFWKGKVA